MGAPFGNKNALMHGLYAKNISISEAEANKKMSHDLNHEIVLLRVFVMRIVSKLEGRIEFDEQDIKLLKILNHICHTIGILSTRQAYLNGLTDDSSMLIDELVESNSKMWEKA